VYNLAKIFRKTCKSDVKFFGRTCKSGVKFIGRTCKFSVKFFGRTCKFGFNCFHDFCTPLALPCVSRIQKHKNPRLIMYCTAGTKTPKAFVLSNFHYWCSIFYHGSFVSGVGHIVSCTHDYWITVGAVRYPNAVGYVHFITQRMEFLSIPQSLVDHFHSIEYQLLVHVDRIFFYL
jgi:hypothetical protein